jgi:hypothetical protein
LKRARLSWRRDNHGMRIPALLLWTMLSTGAASSATELADEPVITESSAAPAPRLTDGETYLLALLGVVVIGAFIGLRRRD